MQEFQKDFPNSPHKTNDAEEAWNPQVAREILFEAHGVFMMPDFEITCDLFIDDWDDVGRRARREKRWWRRLWGWVRR